MTGMQGVFLVAAELTRHGLTASPTSRSSFGADILATDRECKRAWSVQVKTNAGSASFWLLHKHCSEVKSTSHVYVLVNLRQKNQRSKLNPEFYVVPSRVLAARMRTTPPRGTTGSVFYSISRAKIEMYKERWAVFEGAENV